jgi:hypothetical protein
MVFNKMSCPICFDTIVEQYKFRCNHSICKSCFRNMTRKGQTIIHDVSMINYPIIQEFEFKKIQCPLCRQDNLNDYHSA